MPSRALLLLAFLLAACSPPREPDEQPTLPHVWNGGTLPQRGGTAAFRFLVTGHLYGRPGGASAPASTFVSGIPRLPPADLLVLCGDTFWMFEPEHVDPTLRVLERVPMPVFNAPGNHDVTNRGRYVATAGATFGSFRHGGCLFVLLDTESVPWEIAGDQLEFLRRKAEEAERDPDVRALFCFGHKLVFAHRMRYLGLLLAANAHDGLTGVNRFVPEVLPLLTPVAAKKPVYWFAGDVGQEYSVPLFHDRDPGSGVVFVATGLGDHEKDLVVAVDVAQGASGTVGLVLHALGGSVPPPLETFGLGSVRKWADGMKDSPVRKALEGLLPP